jgi:predicted restriction endonuclease
VGRERKPRVDCPVCGVEVENLRSRFCSNRCQGEHQHREYILRWKAGLETGNRGSGRNLVVSAHVRRYLYEKYGERCTRCGWAERHEITGHVPVNVEHINGNPHDSSEANLTILCPNCHSLTLTYGNLNRGNGRTKNPGPSSSREDTRLAVS